MVAITVVHLVIKNRVQGRTKMKKIISMILVFILSITIAGIINTNEVSAYIVEFPPCDPT